MAVRTGSPRSRRDRVIKLHLHRVANLATDVCTWCDNLQLQEDKDQLVGLGRHFVAHQIGDLDNGELIQAVVAEQVIEMGGYDGGAGREETIRQM